MWNIDVCRLRRFAAPKTHWFAKLLVMAGWITSISIVALVPIDVWATLKHTQNRSINTMWSISYWLALACRLLGWLLLILVKLSNLIQSVFGNLISVIILTTKFVVAMPIAFCSRVSASQWNEKAQVDWAPREDNLRGLSVTKKAVKNCIKHQYSLPLQVYANADLGSHTPVPRLLRCGRLHLFDEAGFHFHSVCKPVYLVNKRQKQSSAWVSTLPLCSLSCPLLGQDSWGDLCAPSCHAGSDSRLRTASFTSPPWALLQSSVCCSVDTLSISEKLLISNEADDLHPFFQIVTQCAISI